MKKVSRIIALSLVIMLISGVAVLASETITSVTAPDTQVVADADIKITVQAPVAVDQVTIVVYSGTEATESSIAYIDQAPNTPSGTVEFTFKMRDAFPTGTYTVKVGGTNVSPNGTDTFSYLAGGSYKISGTVAGIGVSPITVGASAGTVAITGNTYEVTGLTGTEVVTLTIGKKGNITYVKDVTMASADVVKDVTLFGGNAFPDNQIDMSDLSAVLLCWGKSVGDAGFDANSNVYNNDNIVDMSDLSAVLLNWGKTQSSYTN